ncbi:hypothetical protein KAR91_72150 [Candidatus Pacearchaeota archaeon]|nr:hypothetical protein [Candidatus Pacearchaeota archaeon]
MLKFLPIRDIVPLPEDLFSALEDGESNPLDNIGVEDFRIAGRVIELDMLCISETILGLPAIDCLGIVIGGNNVTRFGIVVNFSDPFEIAVTTLISLRFSSSLLNPVKLSEDGQSFEIIRDEESGEVSSYQIDLGDITLKIICCIIK